MQPSNNRESQRGEGEHPEAPQTAESRSSSSSSESSTDTGMSLVDVRTILRDNSEAEGRCEGVSTTLDLTKLDFSGITASLCQESNQRG